MKQFTCGVKQCIFHFSTLSFSFVFFFLFSILSLYHPLCVLLCVSCSLVSCNYNIILLCIFLHCFYCLAAVLLAFPLSWKRKHCKCWDGLWELVWPIWLHPKRSAEDWQGNGRNKKINFAYVVGDKKRSLSIKIKC